MLLNMLRDFQAHLAAEAAAPTIDDLDVVVGVPVPSLLEEHLADVADAAAVVVAAGVV